MATRKEVYAALDSERDYQDKKWNEKTTRSKGIHTMEEWLVYMEDYIAEAKHTLSRRPNPECDEIAIHTLRKITAMGVHAMEQLGAPLR
jgi:hypothetical protein